MKRVLRLNITLLSGLGRVLGMTNADLMEATGISNATWYRIMGHPDEITVQQLISIANGLCVPVRRFFSYDGIDMVGSKDDYVANPYQSCYYDGDAMLNLINTSSVATWMDVASVLGMTRTNLRHSLLLDTRLPVTRFLSTCEYLGIDPFLVIVDTNPLYPNNQEKSNNDMLVTPEYAAIQHDINTIQHEMANFNAELTNVRRDIADLGKKIDALLGTHKKRSSPERIKRAAQLAAASAKENQRLLDKKIVNE
ncbi:MAG: hypothetical protein J5545_08995 [Bacteroidaceae bacterium]|nr:hypothetical protein [Bacteroidaceae bacterium]